MTVLLLGGGGREHALAWAMRRGAPSLRLLNAPGNPGIAAEGAEIVPCQTGDLDAIARLGVERGVSWAMIGPEAPLVRGVADALRAAGIPTVGPSARAAEIEGSKAWAKEFMARHAIPTARFAVCESVAEAHAALERFGAPVVVKADGLAAGKGAFVCATRAEAEAVVASLLEDGTLGEAGARLVVEECMRGPECSVLALTDGETYRVLPVARDHKRLLDGDRGPNTGGMGVVAPLADVGAADFALVERTILEPTLRGMRAEGRPFVGVLYAGLMWTADGPRVIEYNCRFGDPEAEAVLPLLEGDVAAVFEATARGELARADWQVAALHAHTVVLAAGGYPDAPQRGASIHGVDPAQGAGEGDALVFHAGTERRDGALCVAGGRVLAVTGRGPSAAAARDAAHRRIADIHFDGMQYRRDIGQTLALPAPTT